MWWVSFERVGRTKPSVNNWWPTRALVGPFLVNSLGCLLASRGRGEEQRRRKGLYLRRTPVGIASKSIKMSDDELHRNIFKVAFLTVGQFFEKTTLHGFKYLVEPQRHVVERWVWAGSERWSFDSWFRWIRQSHLGVDSGDCLGIGGVHIPACLVGFHDEANRDDIPNSGISKFAGSISGCGCLQFQ